SQGKDHHAPAARHATRELRRSGARREPALRLGSWAAPDRRQALRARQGRPRAHGRAGLPGRARGRALSARDDSRERREPRPGQARRQGAGHGELGRWLRRPAPRDQRVLRPHGGGLRRGDRPARALRRRHGRAPDGHPRGDRDGRRGRVAIGPHHLVEVAGVLVFGALFYSCTYRWFEAGTPGYVGRRALLIGAAVGGLAVVLITASAATRRIVNHHGRRYEIVIYRESAEREAAETAQREAADLRAVALLASAAAHEINNPLTVVVGSLELLSRHVGADNQERRWLDRANAAARRIRDIVARMTRITRIERSEARPGLPPMLDIHKSSDVESSEAPC